MIKTFGLTMVVVGIACAGLLVGADAPATRPDTNPSTAPATQMTLDLGNNANLKLVLIPAGKFVMGSQAGEKVRDNDETQHEVTISKPFYMGVTEVTQEQYEAVMGNNPSYFKGAQNPVEMVSWDDAVAFCKKLSAKTGKTVRLPTEAEWEYACRAGTNTPFNTGETISTDQANYNGNLIYGNGVKGVYRQKTIAVGSFKPNTWGLYDMHGNVYEWCNDWYGDYPNAAVTDPTGPTKGSLRLLRGGSWGFDPRDCRSASRVRSGPDFRFGYGGFRVVVAVGVD